MCLVFGSPDRSSRNCCEVWMASNLFGCELSEKNKRKRISKLKICVLRLLRYFMVLEYVFVLCGVELPSGDATRCFGVGVGDVCIQEVLPAPMGGSWPSEDCWVKQSLTVTLTR